MGYGTCATSILVIVLLFPFPQAKLSIADLSLLSQKVIMQFFKGGTVSIVLKNHQNVLICFHTQFSVYTSITQSVLSQTKEWKRYKPINNYFQLTFFYSFNLIFQIDLNSLSFRRQLQLSLDFFRYISFLVYTASSILQLIPSISLGKLITQDVFQFK